MAHTLDMLADYEKLGAAVSDGPPEGPMLPLAEKGLYLLATADEKWYLGTLRELIDFAMGELRIDTFRALQDGKGGPLTFSLLQCIPNVGDKHMTAVSTGDILWPCSALA